MLIKMLKRRFGYFPRTFRAGNQVHEVSHVERCWTTGSRRHVTRHYFDVLCQEGAFQLFQDLKTGDWHLVTSARSRKVTTRRRPNTRPDSNPLVTRIEGSGHEDLAQ